MKVPFLDLKVTDPDERMSLLAAVERVLDHGRLINGPQVDEFEQLVANCCSRQYAVGVSSGTDAIYLALRALGVGPGDEVICPCWSWIATANAIALTGAQPVFADIDDRLSIEPSSVERLISDKTAAIVPVHFAGSICQIDRILEIAKTKDLFVVEDCAQAFSAAYNDRPAGSFGHIGCFSMNTMKVFASLGEAGAIVTDSSEISEKLKILRYNGMIDRHTCNSPCHNGRLDTVQASVLLARYQLFPSVIANRKYIAELYDKLLAGLVQTPYRCSSRRDSYYAYTIQADYRDELMAYLADHEVETQIQHPLLMALQPAYKDCRRDELTNALRLLERVLCLPANEKTTELQAQYVAGLINDFYKGK